MGALTGQVVLADVQKTVGYTLAALLIVGFAIAVALNMRRGRKEVGSEIELAANRKPYYDDDTLETRKLDRTLQLGLLTLIVIAVALPLYWLAEPGRQDDRIAGWNETFIKRGETLYNEGANCAACHGPGRHRRRGELHDHRAQRRFRLVGELAGAGAQHRAVSLLARRGALHHQLRARFLAHAGVGLRWAAVRSPTNRSTTSSTTCRASSCPRATARKRCSRRSIETCAPDDAGKCTVAGGKFATLGEAIFNMGLYDKFAAGAYSCGRCHTKGWSYGEPQVPGGGAFGPNLTGGSELRQFPAKEQQSRVRDHRWYPGQVLRHQRTVERGHDAGLRLQPQRGRDSGSGPEGVRHGSGPGDAHRRSDRRRSSSTSGACDMTSVLLVGAGHDLRRHRVGSAHPRCPRRAHGRGRALRFGLSPVGHQPRCSPRPARWRSPGLTGWLVILTLIWWINPPGIGPKGDSPKWTPVEVYVNDGEGPARTPVAADAAASRRRSPAPTRSWPTIPSWRPISRTGSRSPICRAATRRS